MINLIDHLRPHVDRIYNAGVEKGMALASTTKPVTVGLPAKIENEYDDDSAREMLEPHLGAIQDAMMHHACHCSQEGIDMSPGLRALTELLDRPHRIRRIIKGGYLPWFAKNYQPAFMKGGKWTSKFDENVHPRDKNGRFISRASIHDAKVAAAKGDNKKADELRARIDTSTDKGKENLAKLNAAIGTPDKPAVDIGHTKRSAAKERAATNREQKQKDKAVADAEAVVAATKEKHGVLDAAHSHKKARELASASVKAIAERFARDGATAADVRELADHLPHLTHKELTEVRKLLRTDERFKGANFDGQRKHAARVEALQKYARNAAEAEEKKHIVNESKAEQAAKKVASEDKPSAAAEPEPTVAEPTPEPEPKPVSKQEQKAKETLTEPVKPKPVTQPIVNKPNDTGVKKSPDEKIADALAGVKSGDKKAEGELFAHINEQFTKMAQQIAPGEAGSDLAQDTALKLLETFRKDPSKIPADSKGLFALAKTALQRKNVDQFRKDKNNRRTASLDVTNSEGDNIHDPVAREDAHPSEHVEKLTSFLAGHPDDDKATRESKQALRLRLEGHTAKEIADKLGITGKPDAIEKAVNRRITNAKNLVKEHLGTDDRDESFQPTPVKERPKKAGTRDVDHNYRKAVDEHIGAFHDAAHEENASIAEALRDADRNAQGEAGNGASEQGNGTGTPAGNQGTDGRTAGVTPTPVPAQPVAATPQRKLSDLRKPRTPAAPQSVAEQAKAATDSYEKLVASNQQLADQLNKMDEGDPDYPELESRYNANIDKIRELRKVRESALNQLAEQNGHKYGVFTHKPGEEPQLVDTQPTLADANSLVGHHVNRHIKGDSTVERGDDIADELGKPGFAKNVKGSSGNSVFVRKVPHGTVKKDVPPPVASVESTPIPIPEPVAPMVTKDIPTEAYSIKTSYDNMRRYLAAVINGVPN